MKTQILYIVLLLLVANLNNFAQTKQNVGKAVPLGNAINSTYAERLPMISHDGKALYFARKSHPQNMGESNKDDIWVSYWNERNNTWSTAVNIGAPLNNESHNFVVSINTSGTAMYLANDYNGDFKDAISYSYKKGRKWSKPTRLEIPDYKNKSPFVSYHVSKDGAFLLIAAEQDKTIGGRDFYVCYKTKNGWSTPQNLGPKINSNKEENSIFLAADNKTVYFSSNGRKGFGGYDLFKSQRLDDTWTNWSTPVNMGKFINTPLDDLSMSIPASGDYAYLARGPIENTDLYRIKIPNNLKPNPVTFIQAQLIDAETNRPVDGNIYFESLDESATEDRVLFKNSASNYIAQTYENTAVYAQAKGYMPTSNYYSYKADLYEAIDGDSEAYYQNSEIQNLQNQLDDLQRELKKLSQKKKYLTNNKSKTKIVKNKKSSARKKGSTFSDVGEEEDELENLKAKYENHYQGTIEPSIRNEVGEDVSDSKSLKKVRNKYQQYLEGGETPRLDKKKSVSNSVELETVARGIVDYLYDQYFLSVVREVKKKEEVNFSSNDIEKLESKIKSSNEIYWVDKIKKEFKLKYGNRLSKQAKEQIKRDCKEDFVASVSTEITILIKRQKEKSIKQSIDEELATQPKKVKLVPKVKSSADKKVVYQQIDKKLELVSIKKGAVVTLNNIFFEVNEARLKKESYLELDRIFVFMQDNPHIIIEISGHTNGWCSPEFASSLSKERAEEVYNYLVDKGIDEVRISFKGYGKSDPVASNETAEGRKKNQRVELKILDIIE